MTDRPQHLVDLLLRGIALHHDEHEESSDSIYSLVVFEFPGCYYTSLSYFPTHDGNTPTMRMPIRILSAALLVLTAGQLRADGPAWWPQWRGPSGQGYVDDSKAPLEWSESKNLLWKTKLPGTGHSTPIIWGDRLFLTCANDDGSERLVVCVNTGDGTIVWEKTASKGGADKTHSTSSHATASCVTDGKFVYAFFGTPGLFCYDFAGNLVWRHSFGILTSELGWGIGASPVLFENLVIQNCDNDGPDFLPKGAGRKEAAPASLLALDKITGKVVWETQRNQGRGFGTPVVIPTPSGRIDLVLNGPLGVWGYDPKTGKELWHCSRHPDDDRNKFGEPMPLFNREMSFTAAGRESGFLQAIRLGGSDDITKSGLAWEVRRKGIRDVGSGILVNNYLIYADGRTATLSAYDIQTGKQLFFERTKAPKAKAFYASPVFIQGKVLCLRQDGTTFVLEPGPALKIVRENVLSDGTDFSASPAFADGKMFLRSQQSLYCIAAKK
jgi:outer membrane protein assembly factor BamB